MLNYVGDGDILNIVPTSALANGVPTEIGGLLVVPQMDIEADTLGAVVSGGEFTGPKATGFAPAVGDVMYWDVADGEFNSDTTNPAYGHYTVAAASGDTVCQGKLLPLPFVAVSSLDARLDEAEKLCQTMPAAGTQIAMTVNDTYVNMTADLLEWEANLIEARDVLEFQFVFKVDSMDAAGVVTFGLLLGALDLGTVALTTGDANDYAEMSGTLTFKAVGASSTVDVALTTIGSDGGTETVAYTHTFGATGPATTSAVELKARAKAATGHADNKVTQHVGWGRLNKDAA